MFGRGMMIALTGQRRVGKSCVMRRILNNIAENEENHVIYINKEKTSFDMIANYLDLEAYWAKVKDSHNHLKLKIKVSSDIFCFFRRYFI